jgi:hypothetical protein
MTTPVDWLVRVAFACFSVLHVVFLLFFLFLHILPSLERRVIILPFHLLPSLTLFFAYSLSTLFLYFIPLCAHCPPGCTSTARSLVFLFLPCTFSILRIFIKTVSKTTYPTGPQHSLMAHPEPLRPRCLLLHASRNFWEATFATSTSLSIVSFVSMISSAPCTIKAVSFSYAS